MKYKIQNSDMKQLCDDDRVAFATNHITVDGAKVGYMHREAPDFEEDSGWRFFSGAEDQKYIDNDSNVDIHSLNDIANYDPTILDFLAMPEGTELVWSADKKIFVESTPDIEEL